MLRPHTAKLFQTELITTKLSYPSRCLEQTIDSRSLNNALKYWAVKHYGSYSKLFTVCTIVKLPVMNATVAVVAVLRGTM